MPNIFRAFGKTLSQYDGKPLLDAILYHSIIGALLYVIIMQPDLSFGVNKTCQFMAKVTHTHQLVVKRIIYYLKGTSSHGLQLQSSSFLDLQVIAMQIGLPTLLITKAPMLPCVFWLQLSLLVIHVSQSNVELQYCVLAFVIAKIVWTQSIFQGTMDSSIYYPLVQCNNQSDPCQQLILCFTFDQNILSLIFTSSKIKFKKKI